LKKKEIEQFIVRDSQDKNRTKRGLRYFLNVKKEERIEMEEAEEEEEEEIEVEEEGEEGEEGNTIVEVGFYNEEPIVYQIYNLVKNSENGKIIN
jgi:hypothetical protein